MLRTFTELGLVHRIQPAGWPGLHELRVGDNHQHQHSGFPRCDGIAAIGCAAGDTRCLTAADSD